MEYNHVERLRMLLDTSVRPRDAESYTFEPSREYFRMLDNGEAYIVSQQPDQMHQPGESAKSTLPPKGNSTDYAIERPLYLL